jgi:hypothetical protein
MRICDWQDKNGGPYCDQPATHAFEQFYVDLYVLSAVMCHKHLLQYQVYVREGGEWLDIRELK